MKNIKNLNKTINTCLAAGTEIEDDNIRYAKKYLTDNYFNRYDILPHLTYAVCPFPKYNLIKAVKETDMYFNNKSLISLKLHKLHFDENNKFFSIPVSGYEVKKMHEDLVNIFNKYRDGYIREKDFNRIKKGEISKKDTELIKKYGYFRVFDNYSPHITIGNIKTDYKKASEIKDKINEILKNTTGKIIKIKKVHLSFHSDSEIQSGIKEIWSKDYFL